jgi:hypothetical protein
MMSDGRRILIMAEISRLILIACICCCLHPFPAFACRYNVREVGFVDLGIEQYHLYGFVDKNTPAEIASSFEQISYAALLESNIQFEIVDVNQQRDHLAIKYLDSLQIQTFPSAVLVSPDGQSLAVPVTKPGSAARDFEQTLRSAIDNVLSSPKRNEILQQVSKAYGVVLLIEAADQQQNKKAKEAARSAIEQVAGQMEYLPKPIAYPPVLVELDQESLPQEKVLLWSLGLETENSKLKTQNSEPHAVVLYGRARWVGPMFKGEQITQDNLTAVLSVIGEDCECGLDHRWLQGTMLPARWDEKLLSVAAESLGFDPENPIIKAEISRIVGRGISSYPGVPLGYRELVVEPEPASTSDERRATSDERRGTRDEGRVTRDERRWTFHAVVIIAGATVLITAIGLYIVFRAARRKS